MAVNKNQSRSLKKRVIFSLSTVVATFVLIELALQVFSFAAPKKYALLAGSAPPVVKDEKLGHKPTPNHPEHDEKGFRNKSFPSEASIIALGDSQTYGYGVLPEQAWPQQLEALSQEKVYNMAFGGWGPTHSLLLLDEAIALKPRLIIEAVYSQNDLYDVYEHVYYNGQLTELRATDESVITSIGEAENKEPLKEKVVPAFKRSTLFEVKNFLGKYCRLYQLVARVKEVTILKSNELYWKSIKQQVEKNKGHYQIFDNGKFRTVFTPVRTVGLNLDDPRIAEGHRILLEAIRLMRDRASGANIEFVVLLIPTKELVFKDVVYENRSETEAYRTLNDAEELFWHKTKGFLDSAGIYFIDTLPALRERINSGIQPYPASADGHPNAAGYRAIAEFVLSEIKRRDPRIPAHL